MSAQGIYDTAPLGALILNSDGNPNPTATDAIEAV